MSEFAVLLYSISATCICKAGGLKRRQRVKCVAAGKQYVPR